MDSFVSSDAKKGCLLSGSVIQKKEEKIESGVVPRATFDGKRMSNARLACLVGVSAAG